MVRIITILFCGFVASLVMTSSHAQRTGDPERDAEIADGVVQRSGNVLTISDDAPDRYIVKSGDTLWDISKRYLETPWRWPELWRGNKEQIVDPHLIYPGDVLVLDRKNGTLSVERNGTRSSANYASGANNVVTVSPTQRIESSEVAIPLIPAHAVEPYLSRPIVLDARIVDGRVEEGEGLRNAPMILGSQDGRVIMGAGNRAFVKGLKGDALNWNIFRPGRPFIDPETNEILGTEAVFLGTAEVIRMGEPAEIRVLTSKQEIIKGDRLIVAERQAINNYTLKKPSQTINARVLSIYGGVNTGGRFSIIAINKGKRENLEVGDVLALFHAQRPITHKRNDGEIDLIELPDDRFGLVTIFRVSDRVSYALVMDANRPLSVGDSLRNP